MARFSIVIAAVGLLVIATTAQADAVYRGRSGGGNPQNRIGCPAGFAANWFGGCSFMGAGWADAQWFTRRRIGNPQSRIGCPAGFAPDPWFGGCSWRGAAWADAQWFRFP